MQSPPHSQPAKEKKWILNQGILILQTQPGAMLVSDMGRRRWLRVSGIENWGSRLFHFLKKYRSFDEIKKEFAHELGEHVEPLMQNFERSLLVSWLPTQEKEEIKPPVFLERLSSSALEQREMNERLRHHQVLIISDLPDAVDFFSRPRSGGVFQIKTSTNWPTSKNETFNVIITGPGNNRFLKGLNPKILQSREQALLVQLDATGTFFGPVIGLPEGPCLHCLELRRRSLHFDPRVAAEEILVDDQFEAGAWPSHYWNYLEGALSSEIIQLLLSPQGGPLLTSRLIFDFFNNRITQEDIRRFSSCPTCDLSR